MGATTTLETLLEREIRRILRNVETVPDGQKVNADFVAGMLAGLKLALAKERRCGRLLAVRK